MLDAAPTIQPFNFALVPEFNEAQLHANIRSSVARNLPTVAVCQAQGEELSIAGGGPSLADTYQDLTGYVAAVRGSLGWLLDRGVVPQMCGVCDPSPHMVDVVAADPRVTYFVASSVDPAVFDKLLGAGCRVYRWNVSSIPGGDALLGEIEPDNLIVGGGSTMGLRWIVLGYTMGFRSFHLHGLDSSFRIDPDRGRATHAYPDRQDHKDWIEFDGYSTKLNFVGQVADFMTWLDRLLQPDVDPISIKVYGEGLLQKRFHMWKEANPGAHEGAAKPQLITDDFVRPEGDRTGIPTFLLEVRNVDRFMKLIHKRRVCVQAGGNIGIYPAHLAQYFEYVHTFEPDLDNYECLIKNIGFNDGNIRAYNAALGAAHSMVATEPHEPHNCGAIRIVEGDEVPMLIIDDLDLENCDLIWLDIEGYEVHALEGAERTIERCEPAVIIEENETPLLHGIERGAARAWLQDRGYKRKVKWGNDVLFLPANGER